MYKIRHYLIDEKYSKSLAFNSQNPSKKACTVFSEVLQKEYEYGNYGCTL